MRTKFKLLALASAALMLGACSDEIVPTPEQVRNNAQENNAITFSTYMGKTTMTRAGQTGSYDTHFLQGGDYGKAELENWSADKAKAQGFGVFAYYTGKDTYGQYQKATYSNETTGVSSADHEANFMFNQLVWWDNNASPDLITKWTYSPIKYWPNEVKSAAGENEVDDQNGNTSNDPANTLQENGGNVSFFAYAPYVDFGEASPTGINYNSGGDANEGKVSGIVAINGINTSNDAASAIIGDPILTYKLPTTSGTKAVDLLWGTAGVNGTGVTGAANSGVQGDGDANTDKGGSAAANKYAESILGTYRTNADLTKQTTGGAIQFAFKHALAKIGGSYVGNGEGDDENGTTATNGLMVILDLDDLKGAESGGALEKYLGFPIESYSKAEWNKYNTKVTINELVIDCSKELADGKTADDLTNTDFDFASTDWTKNLVVSGKFNLATGQWSDQTVGETEYKQTTLPSDNNPGSGSYGSGSTDSNKDAIISEELAEPSTLVTGKAGFESIPIGVTTVAKNVYETETAPLVFIPGTRPIIKFTITYTVRTYDPNLKDKYTQVKQKITKRLYITDAIELNKQYNILMHLGLTSVKFTATVSDWETTNVVGTTTTPTDGTSPVQTVTEDIEHVYLPINVGDAEDFTATVDANSDNATKQVDSEDKTLAAVSGTDITLGSTPGKVALAATGWTEYYVIADVTAPKATFDNEEKNVELSHVAVIATDYTTGEPVDWVKGYYTENTVSESRAITRAERSKDPKDYNLQIVATRNGEPTERKANVYITYDNKAITYVLTQHGVATSDLTLKIKNNGTEVGNEGKLTSGVGVYTTTLDWKYKETDKDNAAYGTAASGSQLTEGYTLTETTNPKTGVKFSGTTFTTAVNKSLDTRNVTIKATYGADVEVTKTQDAATVDALYLKAQDGTTAVAVGPITGSATAEVVPLNVFADMTVMNLSTTGEETAKKYKNVDVTEGAAKSATMNESVDWLEQKSGDNTKNVVVVSKNTTPSNRSATVSVTYGTATTSPAGDNTSNTVAINQVYGPVTVNVETSAPTTSTYIETSAKANGTALTYGTGSDQYAPTFKVYKSNGTTTLEGEKWDVGTDANAYKVIITEAGDYYIGVTLGNAPEVKTAKVTVTAP